MRTIHPIVDPLSEYLTVAEAASLLKVHKSTIWRWIENGSLPAYRVGQRGVRLKKADVEQFLTPVSQQKGGRMKDHEPRLTSKEQEQARRAVEQAKRLHAELLKARGGKPFPSSSSLLHELREERTRELS
jgi:excisionase family DNA binding protein